MAAALYSSRDQGTNEFVKDDVEFGWDTIETVYKSDLLEQDVIYHDEFLT